jgi:hypothetical protein
MRRRRAFFAVVWTIVAVVFGVIGVGGGELYHAGAAESAHARALMSDLDPLRVRTPVHVAAVGAAPLDHAVESVFIETAGEPLFEQTREADVRMIGAVAGELQQTEQIPFAASAVLRSAGMSSLLSPKAVIIRLFSVMPSGSGGQAGPAIIGRSCDGAVTVGGAGMPVAIGR